MEGTCSVEGCGNPAHAKTYCRRHYGQYWRKGRIVPDDETNLKGEEKEQMQSFESNKAILRQWHHIRKLYELVVGHQGRMRYRKELMELERQAAIRGLKLE
jgi:hypothetical protein